MVKGTTRQVILVKGTGERLFDQAIFLVREEALANGGITEETLLKEAKIACSQGQNQFSMIRKFLWAGCGAGLTALLWMITSLF